MSQKVLVIGPLEEGALAQSYARAFERLGLEVARFDSERALRQASRFTGNRFLRRALRSVLWNRVNREAVQVAQLVRPDLIFAVKCSFFHPETIREIRNLRACRSSIIIPTIRTWACAGGRARRRRCAAI